MFKMLHPIDKSPSIWRKKFLKNKLRSYKMYLEIIKNFYAIL